MQKFYLQQLLAVGNFNLQVHKQKEDNKSNDIVFLDIGWDNLFSKLPPLWGKVVEPAWLL